jgi:hypothetical protein
MKRSTVPTPIHMSAGAAAGLRPDHKKATPRRPRATVVTPWPLETSGPRPKRYSASPTTSEPRDPCKVCDLARGAGTTPRTERAGSPSRTLAALRASRRGRRLDHQPRVWPLGTYPADDPRVVQVEVGNRRFMPTYRAYVVPLAREVPNPFDGAEGLDVVVLAWGSWLGGEGRRGGRQG